MSKSLLACLAVGLIAATPALAQSTGGGGHGGGRGGGDSSQKPASKDPSAPSPVRQTPTNQIEIIGVITAIDAATSRLTIAYEAVEELNWSHGTMPFPVANEALLKDLKVGQKVRFKVEAHEIYEIKPF